MWCLCYIIQNKVWFRRHSAPSVLHVYTHPSNEYKQYACSIVTFILYINNNVGRYHRDIYDFRKKNYINNDNKSTFSLYAVLWRFVYSIKTLSDFKLKTDLFLYFICFLIYKQFSVNLIRKEYWLVEHDILYYIV